ncbi:hypothetical protein [Lysinibacillus xylanilyticus]|uniref:hypothetical protein n=1 Tax=Lysinibacillus xylanilyticus TaxID=582475 RepID=UPI0036DE4494
MTELNSVLDYVETLPATLQAGFLSEQDRRDCYLILNRLKNAIDITNPSYKNMTALMQESATAVREMRGDVERMIKNRYGGLTLIDDLTVLDAITELGMHTLDDHQNCVSYLSDLAVTSMVMLKYNSELTEEVDMLFKTLLFICIMALNMFNKIMDEPPVKKGVSISFDRKRAREQVRV